MTLFSTAELKTFYSKLLLDRLIPALRHGYPLAILSAQRRMKFGFPFNLQWRVIRVPMDKTLRLPQSIHWRLSHQMQPRLPQSIQYPPGMEPKPLWLTTGIGTAWNVGIRFDSDV